MMDNATSDNVPRRVPSPSALEGQWIDLGLRAEERELSPRCLAQQLPVLPRTSMQLVDSSLFQQCFTYAA